MKHLLPLFCFCGYVAFGLFGAWRAQASPAQSDVKRSGVEGPSKRRAVNLFLLYTLGVSFGAGFLQRDFWPFAQWPLVAAVQGPIAQGSRLMAVDRLGLEHNVDYRAWQPFVIEELTAWASGRWLELAPADRDRAAAFLVQLAERGRLAARRGEEVGYFDRRLGPFAAPSFLLHPKWWSSPQTTPSERFDGVRLYRETWNIEERRLNPAAVDREVRYEYRGRH